MKPPQPLGLALQLSVAAIVVLGMVGGTLIVAHSGYETSPKGGGIPVFVPAPQAYFLAATMFGMSVIGMVALIWSRRQSVGLAALFVLLYVAIAVAAISVIRAS